MPGGSSFSPFGRVAFTAMPALGMALVVWKLALLELPLHFSWPWVPSLGVDLTLHIDGLSALMLLMITGVGCCVKRGGLPDKQPLHTRLYTHRCVRRILWD